MVICYFESLENFLLFFDICIFHPLVSSLCIQILLSCRNDRLFLGLCCFFIVFLIQFYNIVCCICFDHVRSNFSIIECSEDFDHFIRISTAGCTAVFLRILILGIFIITGIICIKSTFQ